MVSRLLEKGHTVTGYNRTRSRAQWLIDRGMKWADSPRGVCEAGRRHPFDDLELRGARRDCRRTQWNAGGTPTRQILDRDEYRQPGCQPCPSPVGCGKKGAEMLDAPVLRKRDHTTNKAKPLRPWSAAGAEAFRAGSSRCCSISGREGDLCRAEERPGAGHEKSRPTSVLRFQMLAFFGGAFLLAEKSGIPRETAVDVLNTQRG